MSRIAIVTDIHVGNHRRHGGPIKAGLNRRCREVIATLRRGYEHAAALQCAAFIVDGDLFDTEKPSPQIEAAVQDVFPPPEPEDTNGPLPIILLGNHDMASDDSDDHALGPLQDRCSIIDKPVLRSIPKWQCELLLVPFQPGPAEKWLPVQVEKIVHGRKKERVRILCIHLGIADANTPKWLAGSDDSIKIESLTAITKERDIDIVVAGNWHDHRRWDVGAQIIQVGTLCPTGWDNPGIDNYGKLVVIDTVTGKITVETIPGPRFLKIDEPTDAEWSIFEKAATAAAEAGNTIYLEVTHRLDKIDVIRKELADLQDDDIIKAFDARLSGKEAQAAAKKAAAAVGSSANILEALSGYMKASKMAKGVSRTNVHKRVRKYLKI